MISPSQPYQKKQGTSLFFLFNDITQNAFVVPFQVTLYPHQTLNWLVCNIPGNNNGRTIFKVGEPRVDGHREKIIVYNSCDVKI